MSTSAGQHPGNEARDRRAEAMLAEIERGIRRRYLSVLMPLLAAGVPAEHQKKVEGVLGGSWSLEASQLISLYQICQLFIILGIDPSDS